MGWTATAAVLRDAAPAAGAANDNAYPGGHETWNLNLHRYYDPAVGRYTQPEPVLSDPRVAGLLPVQFAQLGLPQLHPFAYAANDPMFYIDLDGQVFQGRGGGVGGPGMVAAGDPASAAAALAAGAAMSGIMYFARPKCEPKKLPLDEPDINERNFCYQACTVGWATGFLKSFKEYLLCIYRCAKGTPPNPPN